METVLTDFREWVATAEIDMAIVGLYQERLYEVQTFIAMVPGDDWIPFYRNMSEMEYPFLEQMLLATGYLIACWHHSVPSDITLFKPLGV